MKIKKALNIYKKYFIFLRRKDFQSAIEHAVYINGAKNIEVVDNIDKIKEDCFLQTDNSQIDALIKHNRKIKNCYVYLLLRNCYTDYAINKKKLIKLKKIIKNFHIINHYSFYEDKNLTSASQKLKLNIKLSSVKVIGFTIKEKIKFYFPNVYTIYKILFDLKLAFQLFKKSYLIFCGKFYFTKIQTKKTIRSPLFTKNALSILDRLDKYKEIQNDKIVMDDLKIINKITKNKNFYEKFYLIQCFSRTLIFNHLRKFKSCKLFYKPKLNLIRTKLFKKVIQIDTNSLATPGIAIDRHWNLKKNYNQNYLSFLFFNKNYIHNKKNFYKEVTKIIEFIKCIYIIKEYSLDAISLKKKIKICLRKVV